MFVTMKLSELNIVFSVAALLWSEGGRAAVCIHSRLVLQIHIGTRYC